jgi:hypothetical protein
MAGAAIFVTKPLTAIANGKAVARDEHPCSSFDASQEDDTSSRTELILGDMQIGTPRG